MEKVEAENDLYVIGGMGLVLKPVETMQGVPTGVVRVTGSLVVSRFCLTPSTTMGEGLVNRSVSDFDRSYCQHPAQKASY